MKKKLDANAMINELRGESAHFRPSADVTEEPSPQPTPAKEALTVTAPADEAPAVVPVAAAVIEEEQDEEESPKAKARRPIRSRTLPLNGATREQGELIETIRKNVKPIGKEAAFCRFTPEEKNALGDVVYTYKRNGIRTSENEIVRVAVNWLLENYHADGQNSVLAQVLEKLNA